MHAWDGELLHRQAEAPSLLLLLTQQCSSRIRSLLLLQKLLLIHSILGKEAQDRSAIKMPLLKRKAYTGLITKPPEDLQSQELVFQVRFTKEIFRDYTDYLKKIHLYHQKMWTCKVTGRSQLTYEEALSSECEAAQELQQFPPLFIGPVLMLVQFSDLRLENLVNKIMETLKGQFFPGEEVIFMEGNMMRPCKVLKVMETDHGRCKTAYEIGLLDNNKNVMSTIVGESVRLLRKKNPFTRALLKSFIRESVKGDLGKNAHWVVHDKLCQEYKVPTDPPDELKKPLTFPSEISSNENLESQMYVYIKRRKRKEIKDAHTEVCSQSEAETAVQPITYPIDDSLVLPDTASKKRPIPSFDFVLPMHCIGPLLMVWNFCISFARIIRLSPFSLDEIEKAMESKTEDHILLKEMHITLLHSALTCPVLRQLFVQKRRRKVNISVQTWNEDIADFLELDGLEKFEEHSSTIRKARYRHLDTSVKLDILCELVSHVLSSNLIRNELDRIMEERKAISVLKRLEKVKETKDMNGKHAQVITEAMETSAATNTRVHLEDGGSDGNMRERKCPSGITDVNSQDNNILLIKDKGAPQEDEDMWIKDNQNIQAVEDRHQERKLIELQRRREQLEKDVEKHTLRINSLGLDRDYNRYWFFSSEGRIFVEDMESTKWGYYSEKEELEALCESLNPKDIWERSLQRQLRKYYNRISNALHQRRKEIAQRASIEESTIERRRSSRVKHVYQQNLITYKNKYRTP